MKMLADEDSIQEVFEWVGNEVGWGWEFIWNGLDPPSAASAHRSKLFQIKMDGSWIKEPEEPTHH